MTLYVQLLDLEKGLGIFIGSKYEREGIFFIQLP